MSESSADLLRRAAGLLRDDEAWAARPGPPYASPDLRAPLADWLGLVDRLLSEGFDANAETHAALRTARAILREPADD